MLSEKAQSLIVQRIDLSAKESMPHLICVWVDQAICRLKKKQRVGESCSDIVEVVHGRSKAKSKRTIIQASCAVSSIQVSCLSCCSLRAPLA